MERRVLTVICDNHRAPQAGRNKGVVWRGGTHNPKAAYQRAKEHMVTYGFTYDSQPIYLLARVRP